MLGFSEIQISQVLSHCSQLFTIKDICTFVEIWDLSHAHRIYDILQKVFGDMNDISLIELEDEYSSDQEDDFSPEDWNDLRIIDDELAEMAMDGLAFPEMDESEDDSVDIDPNKDVPFSALHALLNLSFDAVL